MNANPRIWNGTKMIPFTKEEREFIYIQLLARKQYFMDDMKEALNNDNLKRTDECRSALNKFDNINSKLLN